MVHSLLDGIVATKYLLIYPLALASRVPAAAPG
jgi:hypothetical protein